MTYTNTSSTPRESGKTPKRFSLSGSYRFSAASRKEQGSKANLILQQGPARCTTLGWLLEEIHVTWAQLEKTRTRPRPYTNYLEENHTVLCLGSCETLCESTTTRIKFLALLPGNSVADKNLRELSGEEAWEAIENFAQGQKEWDNPPNIISKQELANLNTCNNDIPLSSREVPIFNEPEPQPQPLPNFPSLNVSLGDERGLEPSIKPHSPDSFRMKVVDNLTINTPPSPHVASFHPKDTHCYYHPCIDDPKKHYGFKPGLLEQSGSLGVDFSNMEMIEND
ncbi:hypothetical protein Tco_1151064 [Tanacetum coccineum]